jgi:glycosyltransferase involved in cell wall biosynthesis
MKPLAEMESGSASGKGDQLRFAVIHWGARLHYAVPAVLHSAGMLQRLYTDAHADAGPVRPLRLIPEVLRPKSVRRLLSRKLPESIPKERVRALVSPVLRSKIQSLDPRLRLSAVSCYEAQAGPHALSRLAIRDNFGGANALYVHPCVSTDAIREAKRRGLLVVLEAISHPFNMRVQQAEYDRLGLPHAEGWEFIDSNIEFFAEEACTADVVLAASEYVKSGLIELGLTQERIAVVPYGLDPGFYSTPPSPVPGRILYVGTVDPHKGIAYLAEAARMLRQEGRNYEIRAIGPISMPGLTSHPAFEGLNYLGQVPRDEVKEEFARADLFVFPTLTDGFGIVLLEALFAGLPIVCTPCCGDVVKDGYNGRVVRSHDSKALADALREIMEDRALREKMSAAALLLREDFGLNAYRRRLLESVRDAAARREVPG